MFCSQSTWARTVDKSRLVNACFVSRSGVMSLVWKLGGKMSVFPSITGTAGTPVYILQCCLTTGYLRLSDKRETANSVISLVSGNENRH